VLDAARQIGQEAEEAAMTLYDRLIAEGEAKGIAKGKAEGKAEGMAALILRQLARFGPIPPEVAARVRAASVQELVAMADRMAAAKSIAEVLG
jgi:flagellar biosynthesis/type III secretory pathway protein FliH